jgi:hypothetical protein
VSQLQCVVVSQLQCVVVSQLQCAFIVNRNYLAVAARS